MAGGCFLALAGLAALVFQVMAFILFIHLGRLFREQAEIARATWAAAVVQASPSTPPSPLHPAP